MKQLRMAPARKQRWHCCTVAADRKEHGCHILLVICLHILASAAKSTQSSTSSDAADNSKSPDTAHAMTHEAEKQQQEQLQLLPVHVTGSVAHRILAQDRIPARAGGKDPQSGDNTSKGLNAYSSTTGGIVAQFGNSSNKGPSAGHNISLGQAGSSSAWIPVAGLGTGGSSKQSGKATPDWISGIAGPTAVITSPKKGQTIWISSDAQGVIFDGRSSKPMVGMQLVSFDWEVFGTQEDGKLFETSFIGATRRLSLPAGTYSVALTVQGVQASNGDISVGSDHVSGFIVLSGTGLPAVSANRSNGGQQTQQQQHLQGQPQLQKPPPRNTSQGPLQPPQLGGHLQQLKPQGQQQGQQPQVQPAKTEQQRADNSPQPQKQQEQTKQQQAKNFSQQQQQQQQRARTEEVPGLKPQQQRQQTLTTQQQQAFSQKERQQLDMLQQQLMSGQGSSAQGMESGQMAIALRNTYSGNTASHQVGGLTTSEADNGYTTTQHIQQKFQDFGAANSGASSNTNDQAFSWAFDPVITEASETATAEAQLRQQQELLKQQKLAMLQQKLQKPSPSPVPPKPTAPRPLQDQQAWGSSTLANPTPQSQPAPGPNTAASPPLALPPPPPPSSGSLIVQSPSPSPFPSPSPLISPSPPPQPGLYPSPLPMVASPSPSPLPLPSPSVSPSPSLSIVVSPGSAIPGTIPMLSPSPSPSPSPLPPPPSPSPMPPPPSPPPPPPVPRQAVDKDHDCYDDVTDAPISNCTPDYGDDEVAVDNDANCVDDISGTRIPGCNGGDGSASARPAEIDNDYCLPWEEYDNDMIAFKDCCNEAKRKRIQDDGCVAIGIKPS